MTAQRADELLFSDAPLIGTPEERAMALAFKKGERDAYEAIHERYEARVRSVCRRMLSDPDDAQEAAQEAFLRVYQGLPRFNGRYRLGAWIVRITTNVCLDQLRARTRRPADPVPRELLDLESPLAEDTDPQILFLRHAEGRRVRKVLDSLPPLHRAAIVLRDFEGIAYADIAETLGITEGQVKALLHRARKGFKRSWAANMASMLLPAGMFKRFFKPWDLPSNAGGNATVVSNAAESALSVSGQFTASAAQAVSACGGALHQCSQFMADKAAPVVAAVVVGTATVGAAATVNSDRAPRPNRDLAPTMSGAQTTTQRSLTLDTLNIPKADLAVIRGGDKVNPGRSKQAPPAEEATAPALPPEPTPTPAPSPTEEPTTPADPGAENPAPQPPPAPIEPEGFDLGFGIDLPASGSPCTCVAPTTVVSQKVGVSDQGMGSMDVVVTGTADAAGTPSYGLGLNQSSQSGMDHLLDFTLRTAEGLYMYSGIGQVVERAPTEWGGWMYRYEGSYSVYSSPSTNEIMPRRGTYVAEVVVSWRQTRIVETRVSLSESKESRR